MVNRARIKAYSLLFAAFVLGVVVGGGIFFAYAERRHAGMFEDDRRGALESRRLRALSRKLSLNHDQEEKIATIVKKHRQTGTELASQMFDRCGESLRQHRSTVDSEIRALLTPEQQQRYAQLMERRRHRLLLGPDLPPPAP